MKAESDPRCGSQQLAKKATGSCPFPGRTVGYFAERGPPRLLLEPRLAQDLGRVDQVVLLVLSRLRAADFGYGLP